MVEQELHQSSRSSTLLPEEAHQIILDALPGVALLLRQGTRVIVASNKAAQAIGAIPGENCYSTWKQRKEPCPFCLASLAQSEKKAQRCEIETIGLIWDTHWVPVSDDLYIHFAFDITEQKYNERALQASERALKQERDRVRRYLETVETIIVALDCNGTIETINRKACQILGYTENELIGKNWFSTCLSQDVSVDVVFPTFQKLIQGEIEPFEYYENSVVTKSGEIRDIAWHNALLHDDRGTIVGTLSSGDDITEKKRSESALAEEKERLAVTLRSIGDGVITTDISGTIQIMNKAAEDLTGWTQDEAFGRPVTDVFSIVNEFTKLPCDNPIEKVLKSGQVVELANHTLLISRNGREIVIADSGAPIKDKKDQTFGVVLVFRDITEKQKFLETAQQTARLDSLAVLAGGIAHDFNNLLGGIFGFIDVAYEATMEKEVSENLHKALNTIERARNLTQQLLTFSKGGSPIRKIDRLFPFLQEIALFVLSGSKVTCTFTVDNNLWLCDFDKHQLSQVFDNIIINAMQAMPSGGIIEISARNVILSEHYHSQSHGGRYLQISVKDSGVGIPKSIRKRIFDPFFTTKPKGHGLGLAICYSIISKHDGWIEVDSTMGKGSTFHIFLPAAPTHGSSLQQEVSVQFRGEGVFLVMDDEAVIRETMHKMLTSIGYTVVCKENGQDAIDFFQEELAQNRPVAGLIFDLTIAKGMDGREAIQQIRAFDQTIPAFVMSGFSEDPVMANPTSYGFTASICKPFRKSELIAVLSDNLGKKRSLE